MRSTLAWCSVLVVLASGCLGSDRDDPDKSGDAGDPAALADVVEAVDFRLAFQPPVVVSPAMPIVNNGEPFVDFLPDGRLLVTFTGCENPSSGQFNETLDGGACFHSPLFRQAQDGGWERLGDGTNGRLHPDAPFSQGDAIVVVAPDGTVYHSFLTAAGIELLRSDDAGDSWTRLPPIDNGDRDRQWLSVAADGSIMLSYRGRAKGLFTQVSTDRGQTWSKLQPVLAQGDWTSDSPAVWRPDCGGGFIAYSVAWGDQGYDVFFARSNGTGGWTTEAVATGITVLPVPVSSPTGDQDAFLAPDGLISVAVAPDCTPYVAWAQQTEGDSGIGAGGSHLMVAKPSPDGWTVRELDLAQDVVMPWIQADADQLVVAAYTRGGADPDETHRTSQWRATVGIIRHDLFLQETVQVDSGINDGEICTTNPACLVVDRSVLDHISLAVAPDGRLAFAYVAQPPLQGFQKTIRVVFSD